ncbi:MAG: hypothetical protein CL910_07485 [Deltaproteobacteria bacterium]|jgi:hypothetical protein|nr:hypothetical protein [Deltaproteobacteria bacterium]
MTHQEGWRRCSSCREWIDFETGYYTCNVSTCNRKNTAFVFCSVSCWDAHLPTMNHREAWAEDQRSPSSTEWARQQAAPGPTRKPREPKPAAPRPAAPRPTGTVVRRPAAEREPESTSAPAAPEPLSDDVPDEILIVASRLKDYIRARSGMNTSERVLGPLSVIVREVCDRAIENARRDERKTVLDRDVPTR